MTNTIQTWALLSLTIQNFKGVREFHHDFNGQDWDVYADNGIGKTTLFDAVCWLCLGKDSSDRAKFECKVIDTKTGETIHFLEHAVEAVFGLPDGGSATFKKCLTEDWVTQRGSTKKTFQGHTCKHWVNTVPLPENQFLAKLEEACPRHLIELLGNPDHFHAAMDWKERRALLLEVCGDVTELDVIASNPELAGLAEVKGNLTIEEFRSVSDEKRKAIDREIKLIPVKVAEAERAILDVAGVPTAEQLAEIRARLDTLREERTTLVSGGGVAEKTNELRTAEGAMQEILNRINAGHSELLNKSGAEVRSRFSALQDAQSRARTLVRNIQEADSVLAGFETKRTNLLADLTAIKARAFEFSGAESCAACGQALPADKVEGARAKAEEDFNLKKSRDLEANMSEGMSLKTRREATVTEREEFRADLARLEDQVLAIAEEHKSLEAALKQAEASAPNPVEDGDYVANLDLQRSLKEQIERLRTSSADAIAAKDVEIQTAMAELQEAEKATAAIQQGEQQRKRIQELGADEKRLAGEYELEQQNLWKCDEFVRTKVALLTDKINSKFKVARFKLFEQQVNGGIKECCEALVDFVPYSTNVNTAGKVNVGLDIVNTLAEHYGIAPFVFVDRCESVTKVCPSIGQQIRLRVSEPDKKLRFVAATTATEKVSA